MNFPEWTHNDFDAYEERKWRSNRFNLERMRTRERIVEYHRILATLWAASPNDLEVKWSHDHPTVFNNKEVRDQWCFSLRDEAARRLLAGTLSRSQSVHAQIEDPAIHHLHAILASRIDHREMGVFWAVHQNASVDIESWGQLLDSPEAKDFLAILQGLPEGTALRIDNEVVEQQVWSNWEVPEWEKAVARLKNRTSSWIQIGLWTQREQAIHMDEDLEKMLAELCKSLGALHRLVQWSEQQDRLNLQQAMAEEKKARQEEQKKEQIRQKEKSPLPEASTEEDEPRGRGPVSILGDWRKKRSSESRPHSQNRDSGRKPRDNDRRARNRPDKPSRHHPERPEGKGRGKERNRHSNRKNKSRGPSTPRKNWVEATGPIIPGVRVRMKDGLFSGRDGDVIELNSKGEAKVLVGQFPTWVALKSLTLLKES